VHHAINMPLFGPLADPMAAIDIAVAAEESGFEGFFVWDHVLSPVAGDWDISDPWVVLSAVATRTERIRIGTMVTPLPRRRVAKLARETVTLDRLSGGRLTLGLGAGGDRGRELSAFGEPTDAKARWETFDEGADVLARLWSGDNVTHHGRVIVDDVSMRPSPDGGGAIPIWIGCHGARPKAAARAARFDGLFPLDVEPDDLARMLDTIAALRGSRADFDVALPVHPKVDVRRLEALGATWAMHSFWPGHRPEQILRFIGRGRPE
jgi:alkanesulfonate monooxygenase SsuD/methylene tetrahydromethanopterin reductase-like flavin-dependent oxidoreductase (luciferase family)